MRPMNPARLFATLFCTLTLSTALAADTTLRDGLGNPVRSREGKCLGTEAGAAQDPRCLPDAETDQAPVAASPVRDPRSPAAAEKPAPVRTADVRLVTPVPFATGKAGLPEGDRAALMQFLTDLEGYARVDRIAITGYADPRGRRAYNAWLSGKRAESVYLYLRARGIDPRTTTTRAGGELAPPTGKGPAASRHVEITAHVTLQN
ncbi:MAG: OmpA family protein [Gammaproteobacteria bacterium]|jgi:outer membrane protein OmpA-like peptidoglycan-associated protein